MDSTHAVFCTNCLKTLKEKKFPSLSIANGLALDEIPDELKLTDLEEQFIAKCLIFLKVVKLPTSRMKAMKDRIINVPMSDEDVRKTITSFPRSGDDSGVVAVKLKRMMGLKTCHVEEYINPPKLVKAVRVLRDLHNPFYQDIIINENFAQNKDTEEEQELKKMYMKELYDKVVKHMPNLSEQQRKERRGKEKNNLDRKKVIRA